MTPWSKLIKMFLLLRYVIQQKHLHITFEDIYPQYYLLYSVEWMCNVRDGHGMLLKYVCSYVTKAHNAYNSDFLYAVHTTPYQAAFHFKKKNK